METTIVYWGYVGGYIEECLNPESESPITEPQRLQPPGRGDL